MPESLPLEPPPRTASDTPGATAAPPAEQPRTGGPAGEGQTLPLHDPLPPAPALPNLPGYEVLGEVGRGGMGVVSRAWVRADSGEVAGGGGAELGGAGLTRAGKDQAHAWPLRQGDWAAGFQAGDQVVDRFPLTDFQAIGRQGTVALQEPGLDGLAQVSGQFLAGSGADAQPR